MITTAGLTYLTADEPGIGGSIKQRPEDFIVDEQPLYDAGGRGDHLYLLVEKRRRLTTDVVRILADHFKVPWDSIGYAGLKDKHAITRQWFSIEHVTEAQAAAFSDEHIEILTAVRHTNKLKRGHLRTNRFDIRIRDVEPTAAVRAGRILNHLARVGAPNFVGEQRFGYRFDNHLQGRYLLLDQPQDFLDQLLGKPMESEAPINQRARRAYDEGDYAVALDLWPTVHRFERQALGPLSRGASPRKAVRNIDKPHRMLLISAFQSAIFNRLLNDRLQANLLNRLVVGDVAVKHDTGGRFEVRDLEAEQPRCDRFEISPTGPMWGKDMKRATGEVAEWEAAALAEAGVTEQDLVQSPCAPTGSRRAFRMPIHDPQIGGGADEHGPYVHLSFELPRGCFATVVLREIMKNEDPAPAPAGAPAADAADD